MLFQEPFGLNFEHLLINYPCQFHRECYEEEFITFQVWRLIKVRICIHLIRILSLTRSEFWLDLLYSCFKVWIPQSSSYLSLGLDSLQSFQKQVELIIIFLLTQLEEEWVLKLVVKSFILPLIVICANLRFLKVVYFQVMILEEWLRSFGHPKIHLMNSTKSK